MPISWVSMNGPPYCEQFLPRHPHNSRLLLLTGARMLYFPPHLCSCAVICPAIFRRDLGFLHELSLRRVNLIFGQSRMLVISESSTKRSSQLTQLSFEGFLEAMVRLALIKALPSDKEMRRHGFQYPGELFGAQLDLGHVSFEIWLGQLQAKQRRGSGDPIWRRLDILILLIVNIMQFGVEKTEGGAALLLRGSPDEMLSLEEVRRYYRQPTPHVFESGGGSKPADGGVEPAAEPERAKSFRIPSREVNSSRQMRRANTVLG